MVENFVYVKYLIYKYSVIDKNALGLNDRLF